MIYTITEKNASAAPEILYGPGAKRQTLTLQHTFPNGKGDALTSHLYVDPATFEKYGIGDKIHVGLDFALAEPVTYDQVKELHDELAEDGIILANGSMDKAERPQ